MYKTFLEVYIFILCINGMILVAEGLLTDPNMEAGTPFDIDQTLTGNSSMIQDSHAGNSTLIVGMNATSSSANPLDPLGTVMYPLDVVWSFIGLLTGGSLFGMLGAFGFPDIFVYVIQGIMGVFLAVTIVHYVFGR